MAINIHYLKGMIDDHMSDQPYSVKCGGCGGSLMVDTEVDNDFDLKLTVHPCDQCMEEAADEARQEYEK